MLGCESLPTSRRILEPLESPLRNTFADGGWISTATARLSAWGTSESAGQVDRVSPARGDAPPPCAPGSPRPTNADTATVTVLSGPLRTES